MAEADVPTAGFKEVPSVLLEPLFYLDDAHLAARLGVAEWQCNLPLWVPHRMLTYLLRGSGGVRTFDGILALRGPWVWATQFSNCHETFHFDEPTIIIDGATWLSSEHYYQAMKSYGTRDHDKVVELMATVTDPLGGMFVIK